MSRRLYFENLITDGCNEDTHHRADDIEETIDLPDGKGNIVSFRVLDVIEYKQKQYAILGPASIDLINRGSLLILQLKTNFKGELTHVGVTKPSLIEKIYEAFKSSNTDRYNFAD